MRGLRVLLLGQGRLEFDGQPMTRLMPAKQQALVFYLAATGRAEPRSRLATLLWGEMDEPTARANLRVALTRLRRWLPGALEIDHQRVGLAPGSPVAVDWEDLRAALSPEATPPFRLAASAAWRGPLLDGFDVAGSDDFDRWLAQARQRARNDAISLRRSLFDSSMADGDVGAAIEHARSLLEIDDADEPAHMALMALLAGRGQRTAALAQYEACRAALVERLGARPSATCYALYTRIHADRGGYTEPTAAAPSQSVPDVVDAPAAPPGDVVARSIETTDTGRGATGPGLIGRETERALLRERLADPECRWLTITGPGGIGKTSLAQATAAALGTNYRHGSLWFSGRDEEGGALRDAEALAQQVLARIGDDRHRPGALLLVLDNLETVPGARDLPALLHARMPGVMVLATSRTRVGGSREWLLELAGLSLARAVDDATAPSPAARLFIASARRLSITCDAPGEAEAIERICTHVSGLPLALEMAAHAARREGVLGVQARLAEGAPLSDPDRGPGDRHRSMEVVLRDAWALLDEDTRDAARHLAWLPAGVDTDLAAAIGVSEVALDTLRDHSWLLRAENGSLTLHPLQQDFLRRQPNAPERAPQVRDAVLAHLRAALPPVEPFGDLAPDRAHEMHALASRAALAPAVLADTVQHLCAHAEASVLVDTADRIVACLASVDRQAEAAQLLAASCHRPDLPPWRTAGWHLRRAELLNGAGMSVLAQRAYAQGMRLMGLGEFDADAMPWTAMWRPVWNVARLRGWPARADPAREPFTRLLMRSHYLLCAMLLFTPWRQPLTVCATWINLLAPRVGIREEREIARVINAWGMSIYGRARLAGWMMPRSLPRRPKSGNPRLEISSRHGHAALRLALGRWAGLTADLDDIASDWHRMHATRYEMELRSLGAKLAFYEGRLRDAWERFEGISEASLQRPGDVWRAWGPFGQAEVALCLGEPALPAVQKLYARGEKLVTELENADAAYTLRRLGLAARLAWLRGDLARAREVALTGAAAAGRIAYCGFWAHEGYAGLGDVLLALRRHERATGGVLPPLDEAWRALEHALRAHARRFPPALALQARLMGQRALDDDRRDEAASALHRAVALAERQGMRVELARACAALAQGQLQGQWAERTAQLWRDMGTTTPTAP